MKKVKNNRIRNCLFTNNIAQQGGALHISPSNMTTTLIDGCTFEANKGVKFHGQLNYTRVWSGNVMGGAVYVDQSIPQSTDQKVTFNGCSFINNTALNRQNPISAQGGAISASYTSITVAGCSFINNRGAVGGAVHVIRNGEVIITTSRFLSNRAGTGGAVAIHTMKDPSLGDVKISGSSFINNHGVFGGALHIANKVRGKVFKGIETIKDCTFINNTAATIGQSVFSNCPINIINIFLEAFKSTDTFHIHSEAGSNLINVRNTTLHLHRSTGVSGLKSSAVYISSSSILVFASLKVKCPRGFNVDERNSSYQKAAFQKTYTLLTVHCDACPYNTYNLRTSSYHLTVMQPGLSKVI